MLKDSASYSIAWCHGGVQAAVGSGVEDVREVRQRLVTLETGMIKKQRQEDKRGVDLLQKLSEQEVHAPTCHPHFEVSEASALPYTSFHIAVVW